MMAPPRIGTLLAAAAAALLAAPGPAAAGRASATVIVERSTPDEIVFLYTMPPDLRLETVPGDGAGGEVTRIRFSGGLPPRAAGLPAVPTDVVRLGVPPGGEISLTVAPVAAGEDRASGRVALRRPVALVREDGVAAGEAGPARPAAAPGMAELAELGSVAEFRGLRVASIGLRPVRLDETGEALSLTPAMRVTVRVRGGSSALAAARTAGTAGAAPDEWLQSTVANWESARLWRVAPPAASVPAEYFDTSTHWCRIEVDRTGLYAITWNALRDAGLLNPSLVHPGTVRLFGGGGFTVAESLGVTPPEWMRECAIEVRAAGAAALAPGDSILFYGLGPDGWEAEYDPALGWGKHFEHPYSKVNVYWLTWEENASGASPFAGAPRRIGSRAAPGALGDPAYVDPDTAFLERLHYEENQLENFRSNAGDGWYGRDFANLLRKKSFVAPHPDAVLARPSRVRASLVGYAEPLSVDFAAHFATVAVDDSPMTTRVVGSREWLNEDAVLFDSTGTWFAAGEETSIVWINVSDSCRFADCTGAPAQNFYKRQVYLDWFELEYWRRLEARSNQLVFTAPDDVAGAVEFPVSAFTTAAGATVLDITDPFGAQRLETAAAAAAPGGGWTLTARDTLGSAGTLRRYYAFAGPAFRAPRSLLVAEPPRTLEGETLVRRRTGPVDYVVVAHSSLLPAARTLAAHRAAEFRVEVVTTESVMDEFGWGLMDPAALRNFARYAYENWREDPGTPALRYLLLLGDTNKDFRGRSASSAPIFVPSYPGRYLWPRSLTRGYEADYAADEWFAYTVPSDLAPDFAVGRIPAASPADAQFLADLTLAYETDPEWGRWRGRIVLAADDEVHGSSAERFHTEDTEELATEVLPAEAEILKVYETEYPLLGGLKPGATARLQAAFDEGALFVNYIGHGDETKLSDEKLLEFDGRWIPSNGARRPIMVTLSCSVGKFDISRSSLTELLNFQRSGGTLGAFASTYLAFPATNRAVGIKFYSKLFETAEPRRLGEGSLLGKTELLLSPGGGLPIQSEMERYAVLADPALRLAWPRDDVLFTGATSDTLLRRGKSYVAGSIAGSGPRAVSAGAPFEGALELLVTASDDTSGYSFGESQRIRYRLTGPPIFRGRLQVTGGQFGYGAVAGEGEFYTAADAPPGGLGRMRAYAVDEAAGFDAIGVFDNVVVGALAGGDSLAADSLGPSLQVLGPDGAPLAGGAVLPRGSPLTLVASDPHGINVTGVDPFYALGYRVDEGAFVSLSERFIADPGGFSTGRAELDLGDAAGQHTLEIRAADNLNNRSTLSLEIAFATADHLTLDRAIAYPNPFRDGTLLVYRLTRPASVTARIYTLGGRLIRILAEEGLPGENSTLAWDGRDRAGDPVANGVYFARLEAREASNPGSSVTSTVRLARIR